MVLYQIKGQNSAEKDLENHKNTNELSHTLQNKLSVSILSNYCHYFNLIDAICSITRESREVSNSNYNTVYHLHVQSLANTEQFLKQGSGTFLAKGAMKPIYF